MTKNIIGKVELIYLTRFIHPLISKHLVSTWSLSGGNMSANELKDNGTAVRGPVEEAWQGRGGLAGQRAGEF